MSMAKTNGQRFYRKWPMKQNRWKEVLVIRPIRTDTIFVCVCIMYMIVDASSVLYGQTLSQVFGMQQMYAPTLTFASAPTPTQIIFKVTLYVPWPKTIRSHKLILRSPNDNVDKEGEKRAVCVVWRINLLSLEIQLINYLTLKQSLSWKLFSHKKSFWRMPNVQLF